MADWEFVAHELRQECKVDTHRLYTSDGWLYRLMIYGYDGELKSTELKVVPHDYSAPSSGPLSMRTY